MPGKCAAPPAPAMITLMPAALAPLAKEKSRSGVRCAETIRVSYGTPKASSVSAACFMVCQSDWLPMIIATDFAPSGATENPPARRKRRIIDSRVGTARRLYLTAGGRLGELTHGNEPIPLPAADPRLLFHPGRHFRHRVFAARVGGAALRLSEPRGQCPHRHVAPGRFADRQLFQHPR